MYVRSHALAWLVDGVVCRCNTINTMATRHHADEVTVVDVEEDEDLVVHATKEDRPLSLDPAVKTPYRDIREIESGSKQWLSTTHRTVALMLGTWMVFVLLVVSVSNDRVNWVNVMDLQGRVVATYGWASVTTYDTRVVLHPPVYGGGLVLAMVVWLVLTLYLTVLFFRAYRHTHLDYDIQTKVRRWLRIAHYVSLLTITTTILFLLQVTIHISSQGLAMSLHYGLALCIVSFLEMQVLQFLEV